jgi:hypothetical protein
LFVLSATAGDQTFVLIDFSCPGAIFVFLQITIVDQIYEYAGAVLTGAMAQMFLLLSFLFTFTSDRQRIIHIFKIVD